MNQIPEESSHNTLNSSPDNSKSLSTDRVLSILDSEIENIRDIQTRQGWTSWGLIGGIVGALWLLTDELKTGKLQPAIIGVSILVLSAFIDGIRWLIYLVSQHRRPDNAPPRFRWSNEHLLSGRLVFIIEIVRSLLLVFVGFFIAPKWWLSLSALAIAYCWYSLLMLLALISTFTDIPIREGNTKQSIIFISIFVVFSFLSFLSYLYLAPVPTGEVIASYRIAGLLVAISYLILLLGIVTKDSPILYTLTEIRRNIAFNRTSINVAIREAELALSGMQVADAIQREINSILVLVDRVNQATDSLMFQVETMQSHLPTRKDNEDVIRAKVDILVAHLNTCESILRDRTSTMAELNSTFQLLMKRRQRIEGSIPETVNFFNEFDGGMKTILEDVDKRFALYQQQAIEYDKQLSSINTALRLNLNI